MTWLASIWRAYRSRTDVVHNVLTLVMVLAVFVVFKAISRIPEHYRAEGRTECQQASTRKSLQVVTEGAQAVATKASADITRGQAAGASFEGARTRIQRHFQRLENEARHAPPSPVDQCELPAARLRLWIAANAGPGDTTGTDQGAPASQSAAAAEAAAGTPVGADARPGSQPPAGGADVSRTGGAAVRAAELPGGLTR